MAWTIPDKGEGDNDVQSILFQEYLDVLVAGMQGTDCVLNGCGVTGGADMTPAIAKGAVLSNGVMYAIAAADVTVTAADATNPRIDLIVVTSAGALAVRSGTAAASPKPPARTANDVVLYAVYVPANDTAIATTQCVDLRVVRDRNITIYRKSAATTFNTSAVINTYVTVTFPSGLLAAAGRVARVRVGGNYLSNSGTPTWVLTIAYGGTTMYASGATAATTADTDRKTWFLDFDLTHLSASSQKINGTVDFGTPGTWTAATTGLGTLLATSLTQAISTTNGGTAVNSDTANRDLVISWTMSVSNAAVETVCDYATVELI